MKTWVKACLLSTIAFLTLFIISLIIAYSAITKEGQFVSGEHHDPLNGQYHNPEAEKMLTHMDRI